MTGPRLTPLAASLPSDVPFVGPELQEREMGRPFAARLGANENVFGPSPRAIAAMQEALPEIWKYADSSNHDLRAALADAMGAAPDQIVIGSGIDGLLGTLVRLLVAEGDAVVTSDGAYPTFNYHVTGFGGTLHKVPFRDDREDLEALLTRAAETDAKLVYLSNPDNPMGSWHTGAAIEAALDRVPEGCVLCLDEAYIEFAPEGTAPRIDPEDPRVIRFRTFSKAYGLAGARVGYGTGARALIRAFDKVRDHFGMNRPAQAGACAALADTDWMTDVLSRVAGAKERIAEIARANDLTPLPSATNFVTIDCGADGDFARRVLTELVQRGVFVRMPFRPPQDRCIRISAGQPRELDELELHLPDALAAARRASPL
ncbi:pyridoxal phosphate-dependent aminotransferase [Litorisediminicola beolgyonensis]|uniref:Pyridoxal phosphate-dependent aminotransferase n=1 Tax=Litorisediminicola beolgyonensis TaxID=1173614 RepID=A0ABW3ZE70_9RHOB